MRSLGGGKPGESHRSKGAKLPLASYQPTTNIKLALLWAALMFLYIYNDYFGLYAPGKIASIAAGRIGSFEANEPAMVIFSILLAIPASMIFLSAVLPPRVNVWLNVLLGIVYTAVEVLTLIGSRLSYQTVVSLEIAVTLSIIWFALHWPKQAESA